MDLPISLEKTARIGLDITLFTGVGYLCGRVVNYIHGWNLKEKLFQKGTSYVDLKSLALCCVLFIAIDRIAQAILDNQFGEQVNLPIYTIPRMVLSLGGAVSFVNLGATLFKYTRLDKQAAIITMLMSLVVFAQLFRAVETFNARA